MTLATCLFFTRTFHHQTEIRFAGELSNKLPFFITLHCSSQAHGECESSQLRITLKRGQVLLPLLISGQWRLLHGSFTPTFILLVLFARTWCTCIFLNFYTCRLWNVQLSWHDIHSFSLSLSPTFPWLTAKEESKGRRGKCKVPVLSFLSLSSLTFSFSFSNEPYFFCAWLCLVDDCCLAK